MGIRVRDTFGADSDPEMSSLAVALDPKVARKELKRGLPRLSGDGTLRLRKIRVIRYKPGRRCVVEYTVEIQPPIRKGRQSGLLRTSRRSSSPAGPVVVIGKVRARRSGNEGCRLQQAFWSSGFDNASTDQTSVPEPLGVIPEFQMWFQRKVPGVTAQKVLREAALDSCSDAIRLAKRIASAIHKVHQAGVPTEKRHAMEDELRILEQCLLEVARNRPAWESRLKRVLASCMRLGSDLPPQTIRGIHRDFYASQVIVDEGRLWLIDFDLYCLGDPGLDVGNFIGHVTELALRQTGNPNALKPVEQALEDSFLATAGEEKRDSVRVYTTLTIARHIYLSSRFPDRIHRTEQLLSLSEERLGIQQAVSH